MLPMSTPPPQSRVEQMQPRWAQMQPLVVQMTHSARATHQQERSSQLLRRLPLPRLHDRQTIEEQAQQASPHRAMMQRRPQSLAHYSSVHLWPWRHLQAE
jgi:hypothetical protein